MKLFEMELTIYDIDIVSPCRTDSQFKSNGYWYYKRGKIAIILDEHVVFWVYKGIVLHKLCDNI